MAERRWTTDAWRNENNSSTDESITIIIYKRISREGANLRESLCWCECVTLSVSLIVVLVLETMCMQHALARVLRLRHATHACH